MRNSNPKPQNSNISNPFSLCNNSMEFKFRAVDDRPPPFPTPPSSFGYFSEQALRVSAGFPATDPRPKPEQSLYPNGPREAILQRELEKERIREEIIAAEITRRRVLEAEVRRELMMEREMAMKRLTAMGSSAEGGSLLEYRLAMHQYDGFTFPGRISAFDMFQMPLQLPEAMPLNVKQPSEINKDKLIVLAKPHPNLSGAKRKAETSSAGVTSELPPFGLKKRPKEEWSCALCQVSSSSERVLNEHLQGRRHKAKEAGLRAQRMGKSASSTPLPKKTTKPSKLIITTPFATSGPEAKVVKKSLQQNEIGGGSDKNKSAKDSEKTNGTTTEQGADKTAELNKEKVFKFWCEMCQIGAYSQVVMENHQKGKKHKAQLQKLVKTHGVVTMAASGATHKAQDTDLVAEEANKSDATQKAEVAAADVMAKEANKKIPEIVVLDLD